MRANRQGEEKCLGHPAGTRLQQSTLNASLSFPGRARGVLGGRFQREPEPAAAILARARVDGEACPRHREVVAQ